MAGPWNASYSDSTHHTRASRLTYLPPHLRNSITDTLPERFYRSARGGTARGRGHGRGGGQARPRNPVWNAQSDLKFDDLQSEEDVVKGNVNVNAYDDVPVETSGKDIPEAVRSFSELDFCEALTQNINRCKYVKPTPIQRYAIPVAMNGRDLMACAQTGSGKTAAFCFPIINGILSERPKGAGRRGFRNSKAASPLALILAPTRELSCQIHEEAKKFSYETGLKIVVAYGGAPIILQLRNLEKGVDILVATPGRLVDMMEKSRVSLREIKYLALDEADRMLDMGFERQVRRIVQYSEMPPPGKRQTMLFSATFPAQIQSLASEFLSNHVFLSAGKVGSSTDLIVQKVELVHESDKRDILMNLLHDQTANGTQGKSLTLVFVETKRGADALEHWLLGNGFQAVAIHGDKEQMERERALRSFKTGRAPILVATDVASRGLDIPHVSHVINFDLPRSIDYYVHRIGRTGRAGKSGLATAFFSSKNTPLAKDLVELMQGANQEIPTWLNEYAEKSYCGNGERVKKFGGFDYGNTAAYDSFGENWSSQYTETAPPYYPCTADSNPFTYGAPFAAAAGYYVHPETMVSGNYGFEQASLAANDWN
ncbi:PREDICTED: DEAD-box ATP-dependent RNA helicase 52C-like [Ipomoea nil]|uniref:DEAD-box ATP-dependent RNA helicase 52C-like n=1 Tax=Ipomoea nil TaxID=35883 RepID=UPI0009011F19|nr:PREDICTED: DEAD-box ATP-dependent RNA helicase 52C-like [Ipomoea nil]